ncbi:hypothetical protein EON63_11305 [archaeon]|nr:MAG: hypothetical protein EON63_11305 [archaeon]
MCIRAYILIQHMCFCFVDEVSYADINILMALTLGFHLVPEFSIGSFTLQQNNTIAPLRWQNLSYLPDFSDIEDTDLDERLTRDLPKEAEHSGAENS